MKNDPLTITGAQVRAAYDALGLDPDGWNSTQLISIESNSMPGAVTVERIRRDAEGKIVFAGDEAATEIITIGVRWKWGS